MDGGANNPDGKSKLLPGELCSVPSISNKILYNLLLLSWSGRQFLETAACFWPLPSNGSLVGSQSYQDGGPLMTSHVTSGFPCCKPGKSVRGKVHLSQKRVSPSNLASQSTSRLGHCGEASGRLVLSTRLASGQSWSVIYFADPPVGGRSRNVVIAWRYCYLRT